jgi:hypothetical protein
MGWSIGYDTNWRRDIGYGVPAVCDQPGCGTAIDRGLSYVCGGEPYGGVHGCGLYFCESHLSYEFKFRGRLLEVTDAPHRCERCIAGGEPFGPTPDMAEWTHHKMTDPSWAQWRSENGISEATL